MQAEKKLESKARPKKKEMSFLGHLDELRTVLVRVIITLLVGMVLCFGFARYIQKILVFPFDKAAQRVGEAAGQLVLLTPTEGFIVHLKIALFAGLLLGIPVIFVHIWQFVSPGLYKHERKSAFPVILAASVCFIGGSAFGYNVIGFATEFFLRFSTPDIANQWSLSKYIAFVSRLMLAFGVVFELPLVIFILSRMGLVTPKLLSQYRKHAFISILVVGAILTPPDPISQMMLAGPVYLLFEFSILVSRMVYRKRLDDSGRPSDPVDPESGPPGGDPKAPEANAANEEPQKAASDQQKESVAEESQKTASDQQKKAAAEEPVSNDAEANADLKAAAFSAAAKSASDKTEELKADGDYDLSSKTTLTDSPEKDKDNSVTDKTATDKPKQAKLDLEEWDDDWSDY
jgi:sec-independent protein translocase protein TatC